jgi:hypothetical protein
MGSLSTASFHKQKTCPSAAQLLQYTQANLVRKDRQQIISHLAECDFCGAEAQLLARHAPLYETSCCQSAAEMPSSLRHLAEVSCSEKRVARTDGGERFPGVSG